MHNNKQVCIEWLPQAQTYYHLILAKLLNTKSYLIILQDLLKNPNLVLTSYRSYITIVQDVTLLCFTLLLLLLLLLNYRCIQCDLKPQSHPPPHSLWKCHLYLISLALCFTNIFLNFFKKDLIK